MFRPENLSSLILAALYLIVAAILMLESQPIHSLCVFLISLVYSAKGSRPH